MRALKPQFNFNFAEDIPFYSTSHIYNGIINKEKNEDLSIKIIEHKASLDYINNKFENVYLLAIHYGLEKLVHKIMTLKKNID